MEAHGAAAGKLAQNLVSLMPKPLAAKLAEKAGIDRLSALYLAIDIVRRGRTISPLIN